MYIHNLEMLFRLNKTIEITLSLYFHNFLELDVWSCICLQLLLPEGLQSKRAVLKL